MTADEPVLEKTLTVTNHLGLHARVATMMVQTLRNYSSQVSVLKDGVEVNARSVPRAASVGCDSGQRDRG